VGQSPGGKHRRVDVGGEVVVVDENPNPRVRGGPGGEDVQSKMQGPVLGDVVVWHLVGD
jgi:hypothetical protein